MIEYTTQQEAIKLEILEYDRKREENFREDSARIEFEYEALAAKARAKQLINSDRYPNRLGYQDLRELVELIKTYNLID